MIGPAEGMPRTLVTWAMPTAVSGGAIGSTEVQPINQPKTLILECIDFKMPNHNDSNITASQRLAEETVPL